MAQVPLISFLNRLAARRAERRRISELSDSLLQDIGLTRNDVSQALLRPYWRPIDFRHPVMMHSSRFR